MRLFSVSEVTWHVDVHPPGDLRGLGTRLSEAVLLGVSAKCPAGLWMLLGPGCVSERHLLLVLLQEMPFGRRVSVHSEKTEMSRSTGLCSPCLEERRRGRSLVTVMSIADCSFTADLCRASGSLPLL